MNHLKVFSRFLTLILWLAYFGTLYSTVNAMNNIMSLGWPTLLFYFVVCSVVTYGLIFLTKVMWSVK